MTIYEKNGDLYCRFQIHGERKHFKCHGAKNRKEAAAMEAAFKYKLLQQQNGIIPREEKKMIIDKLCDKFLEYSELNKRSYKEDISRVKVIREFFKNLKYINNIKLDNIEQFKRFLLNKGLKQVTVNRYLEVISKMFNIAIRNEWVKNNPIDRDVKFKLKNDKPYRCLKLNEQNRLLEVVKDTYLEGIIIFALNVGLRKSDILPLTWEDIKSYDQKVMHLYIRKTNTCIDLPCTKLLYDFLERTPKNLRQGALFINPLTKKAPKDIKKAWNTAKRKAGIENLRFHDLRHTVATRLVNAGVPLPIVQKIMTHTEISTTMRYVHVPEDGIFKAIEVLNSCNEGLIQND